MYSLLNLIKGSLSRRRLLGTILLGLSGMLVKTRSAFSAHYEKVKRFLVRSIEGTQNVELGTWRLRVEGLVEKAAAFTFAEIKALPTKVQVRNFICVEGWGLEKQEWEGVHLREIFSRVKISPKAKYVTFYATGGKYRDSLSLKEALEPETMLAYGLNKKDLPKENGFPLRLVVPRMYAYKGVKWVERIVFTEKQEIGYWEERGYSPDGSIPGL